jgi:hypothetical protein
LPKRSAWPARGQSSPRRQAIVLPDATVLVTVAPVDELRRLADLLASATPQNPYRAAYALHAVYGGRSLDSAVVELARTISCQWLPLHRMCGSVLRLRRLSRVRPGPAASARCRGARLRALAHAVLAVRGHCIRIRMRRIRCCGWFFPNLTDRSADCGRPCASSPRATRCCAVSARCGTKTSPSLS